MEATPTTTTGVSVVLAGKVDFYNGVTIDASSLPHDASAFDSALAGFLPPIYF
jgi:hypothetical protein